MVDGAVRLIDYELVGVLLKDVDELLPLFLIDSYTTPLVLRLDQSELLPCHDDQLEYLVLLVLVHLLVYYFC